MGTKGKCRQVHITPIDLPADYTGDKKRCQQIDIVCTVCKNPVHTMCRYY